jgi:hypothetical protein
MFYGLVAPVIILVAGVIAGNAAAQPIKFRAADPRAALCHASRVVDTFESSRAGVLSRTAVVGVLETFYGPIHVAIDTRGSNEPQTVTFDFTGTGQFIKATPVQVKPQKSGAYFWGELAPTKADIQRAGYRFPVGIMGSVYRSADSQSVDVQFGTMLESKCNFGARQLNVDIIDGDQNLHFGDKTELNGDKLTIGDTLVIRDATGRYKTLFGQPVQVDGQWYELTIGDDLTLSAVPLDITADGLKISHDEWSAILIGKKYIFGISGDTDPVTIPADTYTLVRYEERVGMAKISCLGRGKQTVTVRENGTTTLQAGSPIMGLPVIQQVGSNVVIRARLIDSAGLNVSQLRLPSGKRPPPPVVGIFNQQGKSLYQATLEYG